jgi:hypothetical protein
MVGIDAITRSVHVHWETAFSACPTVHPGQQIDTGDQSAWVELWVDVWDEQARRNESPERAVIALTVHCFSRHTTATAEARGVVDAARSALSRQLIEVRDYEQSGAPLIGHLRLREAELRDLTRAHDDSLRGAVRHVVVLCRGVMEEA